MSDETGDLSPIEKARAARRHNDQLRAEGKLPPLPPRKRAKRVEPEAEEPHTVAELLGQTEEPELDNVLSDDEIAAIYRRAEAEIDAEEKKARSQKLMALARDEVRRKRNLVPPKEARQKELEEWTDIRIVLPSLRTPSGREIPPDPIILDQRVFVHGRSYRVTRAVAEYLNDRMNQCRMHMAQVDGRARTYYNEQMGTMIHQGGPAHGTGILP